MQTKHTLRRHRDIRNWVSDRHGTPAIARVRDSFGAQHHKLCLSFERQRRTAATREGIDDGMSPCSWTAWLAELDRQNLALEVSQDNEPRYQFVTRYQTH